MKWTYIFDEFAMSYHDIGGTELNEGDPVLVFTRENVLTGDTTWHIRKDFAESGYPGNMDSSIRRFHGWRGTTNDIRVDAMGVYKVKTVEHIKKRNKDGWMECFLKVVLDKKDTKEEED